MANEPRDEADIFGTFFHILGDLKTDIKADIESLRSDIARLHERHDDLPCADHNTDIAILKTRLNNDEKFSDKLEKRKKEGRNYSAKIMQIIIAFFLAALTLLQIINKWG